MKGLVNDRENRERIKSALRWWGAWRQEHGTIGGLPGNPIYRAMAGKLRSDAPWRSNSYRCEDDFIDTDRRVAALPEHLKKVLIAQFVITGDVGEKVAAAGLSATAYYRYLNRALSLLA